MLRYKKKGPKCVHLDSSVASMRIRNGVTRGNFFCPKCRKSQPIEIHAQ